MRSSTGSVAVLISRASSAGRRASPTRCSPRPGRARSRAQPHRGARARGPAAGGRLAAPARRRRAADGDRLRAGRCASRSTSPPGTRRLLPRPAREPGLLRRRRRAGSARAGSSTATRTDGFSVAALAGGATQVTSVDSSAPCSSGAAAHVVARLRRLVARDARRHVTGRCGRWATPAGASTRSSSTRRSSRRRCPRRARGARLQRHQPSPSRCSSRADFLHLLVLGRRLGRAVPQIVAGAGSTPASTGHYGAPRRRARPPDDRARAEGEYLRGWRSSVARTFTEKVRSDFFSQLISVRRTGRAWAHYQSHEICTAILVCFSAGPGSRTWPGGR